VSGPESPELGRSGRRRRRRRRRQPGEPRRGFYLLPHLFTTGNLFFGFWAIVHASLGAFDKAALGIVLAGVFDALDGRVARLARTTSRFGSQYDSIADTVSFGVAPAMLAFWAGNLQALGRTGLVMAFLFTVCAALRLARFNVSPGRYANRFQGLPSPMAAGMVATTQWFVSFIREHHFLEFVVPEPIVAAGTAVLGLLMVSSIPYRSFKEVDLRHPFGTLVLAILVLAVMIQEPRVSFFVVGAGYMVSGPLEWLWRRAAGRPLAEPSQESDGSASEAQP
jgi:CDP-diacylglycerol--serine O-phosphatidyltransferase